MKTVALVKYNAGNVTSVVNTIHRLGFQTIITDNPNELIQAEKVIFPGVGEAKSAMNYLKERGLDQIIKDLKQPVLGICLGLQLLCQKSEEGNVNCIGIFDSEVKLFTVPRIVPHMGWNSLNNLKSPLFKGISEESNVYFVHSYYATIGKETIAQSDYEQVFSSALHKNNFYAVQFHPEKSADIGAAILKNFLEL